MNIKDFTKTYGDPADHIIQCWFCQKSIKPPTCQNANCLKASVNYSFEEYHSANSVTYKLYRVRFKTHFNKREYEINYYIYPQNSKMTILEQQNSPELSFSTFVLSIKCESLILTPNNVTTRLPTLITFS